MAVGQISVFDVASMLGIMIILGDKHGSYTMHQKWVSKIFGAITNNCVLLDTLAVSASFVWTEDRQNPGNEKKEI